MQNQVELIVSSESGQGVVTGKTMLMRSPESNSIAALRGQSTRPYSRFPWQQNKHSVSERLLRAAATLRSEENHDEVLPDITHNRGIGRAHRDSVSSPIITTDEILPRSANILHRYQNTAPTDWRRVNSSVRAESLLTPVAQSRLREPTHTFAFGKALASTARQPDQMRLSRIYLASDLTTVAGSACPPERVIHRGSPSQDPTAITATTHTNTQTHKHTHTVSSPAAAAVVRAREIATVAVLPFDIGTEHAQRQTKMNTCTHQHARTHPHTPTTPRHSDGEEAGGQSRGCSRDQVSRTERGGRERSLRWEPDREKGGYALRRQSPGSAPGM